MRRYSTPLLTIRTAEDLTKWDTVVLTIKDRSGSTVDIVGPGPNMTVESDKIIVRVRQEESGELIAGKAKMQIRAANSSGSSAIASNIMDIQIDDVLKEGVLNG